MSEAPVDSKGSGSSLEAKLRALAERTRRNLPRRAEALREVATRLAKADPGAAAELKRLAHRLHGTAGSYGMHALGELAAEVEALAERAPAQLAEAALELARQCDANARNCDNSNTNTTSNIANYVKTKPIASTTSEKTDRVRALVVDDDPAIGKLVGLLLQRMGGYRVEVVDAPAKALACLDSGFAPALLVVDAMMPEMNGRALARAVRGRAGFEDLPVAVLSAATPEELGWDAGDFTPDAWITKPVSAAELLAALRKIH